MHNEKGKHEVVIRKEESKEPKKKVSSEQASRITSSHSKGKRTDEEEDSLSLTTKKVYIEEMTAVFKFKELYTHVVEKISTNYFILY